MALLVSAVCAAVAAELQQPPELQSSNGALDVELSFEEAAILASEWNLTNGIQTFKTRLFNGTLPGQFSFDSDRNRIPDPRRILHGHS